MPDPGEARLLLPVAWASLAVVAGPAAAAALDPWAPRVRTMASIILWAAWGGVLLATLVPRPLGLTALRAAAPLGVVLAVLAAGAQPGVASLAAVAATAAVTVLAFMPATASRFVNSTAYGDERRFPLRLPPALLLGPLPLAVPLLGAGVVAGPLLLAAGQWAAGVLALVAGAPLAAAMARSLHSLSERWAVLVPAGLVLKDPLTLVDPVLFRREGITGLRPLPYPEDPASDVCDLRLGAVPGSLLLELSEPVTLLRTAGRRRSRSVAAQRLAFSPRDADTLLAEAARRRVVGAG